MDGGIAYKCKYCKKQTDHVVVSRSEKNSKPMVVCKCMVCAFSSAIYYNKGKRIVDQSGIPERTILMPWDDEYTLQREDSVDPIAIEANREIDDWLRNPLWFGSTTALRGRWKLKTYRGSIL